MNGTSDQRGIRQERPGRRRRGWLIVVIACTLAGCQSVAPQTWRHVLTTESDIGADGDAAITRFGVPVVVLPDDDSPMPQPPSTAPPDAPNPVGAALATGLPVMPPTQTQCIDFATALNVAGLENPTIALAEEEVRASEAQRMQARALLLPTLNAGTNVRVHQGTLEGSAGVIRNLNIQSVYVGAGAQAVTAGTVEVPGIRIISPLADAIYAPQAAEQQVVARQFDAVATRHRTLLEVGTGYLALIGNQGRLAALRRSQEDLQQVVQATANFAKAGQGRDSDAQRAQTEWLLLETQAQRAEEDVAVAAADLARLLNLDPSVRLVPADAVPPLFELTDPETPLAALIQIALTRHPELGARGADIAYAEIRIRQERIRPWLPTVSMGYSAGDFGGGGSQAPSPSWLFGPRMDFDVAAVWTLQNLGMGNRAVQGRVRAEAGEAEAERLRVANRIRAEVGEAYTLIRARRREVEIAQRRIATSERAFEEDLRRTRNLEGRPIEVIRSVTLLTNARLDLVRSMVGYSEAQLQLYTALGNSPARAAAPR